MIPVDKNSILIVEDEQNLGNTLHEYLLGLGHPCSWAKSVSMAKELIKTQSPQIILMDIGLPDGNGMEFAKEIKQTNPDQKIIFLSAQDSPDTKVAGLELGAEDYITKPFHLKELVLRLKNINVRNNSNDNSDEINFGPLIIWFNRYEIQDANGQIISLGQKECGILKLLVSQKNNVLPREEIIEKIWGADSFPSNRTVDNYIVKLRRWSETAPDYVTITSVRGVGYKLSILK